MKSLIAIFLLSSMCKATPIITSTNDTVDIKVKNGEVEIILPESAKKALIEWNPEFIVFNLKDYSPTVLNLIREDDSKAVPMAFVADLDNNGEKDVVLLGNDLKSQFAVALMQKNKKWTAVEVTAWSIPDIKQSVIPPSDAKSGIKETGIPLYIFPAEGEHAKKLGKKIGIQVEMYAGPASVYEIKDGKAAKVLLK
ncbi:MAG: hypothetical protein ACM3MG_00100 [Bacillota bacterium]